MMEPNHSLAILDGINRYSFGIRRVTGRLALSVGLCLVCRF